MQIDFDKKYNIKKSQSNEITCNQSHSDNLAQTSIRDSGSFFVKTRFVSFLETITVAMGSFLLLFLCALMCAVRVIKLNVIRRRERKWKVKRPQSTMDHWNIQFYR